MVFFLDDLFGPNLGGWDTPRSLFGGPGGEFQAHSVARRFVQFGGVAKKRCTSTNHLGGCSWKGDQIFCLGFVSLQSHQRSVLLFQLV